MSRPRPMAVATAVFIAGIGNAFIYTLGYLVILIAQFAIKGGSGASLGGAIGSLVITLVFTLLISGIITFLLAFPIAMICRAFRFVGNRAFVVAPAIGAALACAIARLMDVALTTHFAIVCFAYITAAIMWLALAEKSDTDRVAAA